MPDAHLWNYGTELRTMIEILRLLNNDGEVSRTTCEKIYF